MNRLHSRGYSLIELLVVIAIIGILSAIGFINFQRTIQANRMKETQAQVIAAIERARSLSRRFSQNYTVGIGTTEMRIYPLKFDTTAKKWIQDLTTTARSEKFTYTNSATVNLSLGSFSGSSSWLTKNAKNEPELELTVSAPYGRYFSASTSCVVYQLGSSSNDPKIAFKIIGVTGKVVPTGVFYDTTNSPC
jgi:prepilin-type N-terminal cleavage/methylation domain-containing protein